MIRRFARCHMSIRRRALNQWTMRLRARGTSSRNGSTKIRLYARRCAGCLNRKSTFKSRRDFRKRRRGEQVQGLLRMGRASFQSAITPYSCNAARRRRGLLNVAFASTRRRSDCLARIACRERPRIGFGAGEDRGTAIVTKDFCHLRWKQR